MSRIQGYGRVLGGTVLDLSLGDEAEASRYRAEHDPLTGLVNRVGFLAELERRLSHRRSRATDEFALLFLDLDGFKAVNDRLGHLAGDDVLRVCATRLAATVRSDDVIARLGGDEFVVLQTGGPDSKAVAALARALIDSLRAPIGIAGHEVEVGASIGIARSGRSLPDARALIDAADHAMYRAKRQGTGIEFAD